MSAHRDLGLELAKENGRLLQRLMDARGYIAFMRTVIRTGQDEKYLSDPTMVEMEEFMAAGLFGDNK